MLSCMAQITLATDTTTWTFVPMGVEYLGEPGWLGSHDDVTLKLKESEVQVILGRAISLSQRA